MKQRIYASRKRFVDWLAGQSPKAAIELLGQYADKNIPVFYENGSPCFVMAAFDSTRYVPKYNPSLSLEIWKLKPNDTPEVITLNITLSGFSD